MVVLRLYELFSLAYYCGVNVYRASRRRPRRAEAAQARRCPPHDISQSRQPSVRLGAYYLNDITHLFASTSSLVWYEQNHVLYYYFKLELL